MTSPAQPLRCLLVEDLEDDAKLVLRALRAGGYAVTWERVETAETMRAALLGQSWDLVLSDYQMPHFSGVRALELLRATGLDLPFIIVSGTIGERVAVDCMKAGAHDYLMKDALARLVPAIQRELREADDRRRRREAEAAARRSEALLKVAGEIANFGGWIVNLAEGKVVWSEGVALIHEEPPDFSPTLTQAINYYAPEWRDKVTAVFTACARDGTPYDEEMEIITARGRRVWVRLAGLAMRDAAGRIEHVQGAFQDISTRKNAEAVDLFLAQAGVSPIGEPFFPALARFLAENLQMDYICIDRLEGDALNATTLAVWHDGKFEDNVTYRLQDTPCGEVVDKKVCCYPAHVSEAFPNDAALQQLRAESYVGITLFDHRGQPIGLIAVIGRRALTNRAQAEALLARVAPRAAGELERLTAEAALQASERQYRTLFSSMTEGFCRFEVLFDERDRPNDLRFLEINPAFEAQTGLCDVVGKRMREILPLFEDSWYEVYGKVVRTGEPTQFENEAKELRRWYSVSSYRFGEPARCEVGVIFRDITERKLAAEALQASERTQRRLAETLAQAQTVGGVGSWETDLATQQVSWSEQTHRIFETTAATFQPCHQAFLAFVHPDDRATVDAAFIVSAKVSTPCAIEHRIVMPDGRIKHLEERWEILRDENSCPVRAVGTCLVITERKQAELALRTSEQRFKRFMDEIPGLAYIKDAHGRTVFANKGFADLLGLRVEDLVGKRSADFFPADFAQKVDAEDQAVLAAGAARALEEEFSDRIWITRKFPISLEGSGTLLGGITLDATERRKAERALAYREEIFSSIVAQANDAIALIEAEGGRFVEFNHAAHENLGFTREEFAQLSIPAIESSQSAEDVRQRIERVMANGFAVFESRHRHRNGSVRDVRVSTRHVRVRDRDYLTAVWSDITESKQAAAALRQQSDELRSRNATLARFNAVAVGRELRMIELKQEVNELCAKLGEPPRFRVPADAAPAASETEPTA